MKRAFFNSQDLPFTPDNEMKFFLHYFHNTQESRSVPLEYFRDPLNSSHSCNPCFKTLSKDYLCLLFTCEAFRIDFFRFAHTELLSTYESKVYKKFKKLFKKLRKQIRTAGYAKAAEVIRDFIAKFNDNKRCKLPWVGVEIMDAVRCFDAHIQSILEDEL